MDFSIFFDFGLQGPPGPGPSGQRPRGAQWPGPKEEPVDRAPGETSGQGPGPGPGTSGQGPGLGPGPGPGTRAQGPGPGTRAQGTGLGTLGHYRAPGVPLGHPALGLLGHPQGSHGTSGANIRRKKNVDQQIKLCVQNGETKARLRGRDPPGEIRSELLCICPGGPWGALGPLGGLLYRTVPRRS